MPKPDLLNELKRSAEYAEVMVEGLRGVSGILSVVAKAGFEGAAVLAETDIIPPLVGFSELAQELRLATEVNPLGGGDSDLTSLYDILDKGLGEKCRPFDIAKDLKKERLSKTVGE